MLDKSQDKKVSSLYFRCLIVLNLFIMSVGYAAISTTQSIKTGTSITFAFEDVDVYLANLYVNNINKFSYINDDLNGFTIDIGYGTSVVEYYTANNSTQYDELISLSCNDSELNNLSVTFDSGENIASSQSIVKNTLTVTNNDWSTKSLVCSLSYLEGETTTKKDKQKKIIFSSDGYQNEVAYKYINSKFYGDLPELKSGNAEYFAGWYNISSEKIDSSAEITNFDDEVLYAKFEKYSSVVSNDVSSTDESNMNISNVPYYKDVSASNIFFNLTKIDVPHESTGTINFNKSYDNTSGNFTLTRNHIVGNGLISYEGNFVISKNARFFKNEVVGYSAEIDCSNLEKYTELSADNFILDYKCVTLPGNNYGSTPFYKTYDSTSGILKLYRNSLKGSGIITYNVDVYYTLPSE